MMTTQKSRPGGGSGAASSVVATQVQDTETPRIPHLSATEIDASRPTYALLISELHAGVESDA